MLRTRCSRCTVPCFIEGLSALPAHPTCHGTKCSAMDQNDTHVQAAFAQRARAHRLDSLSCPCAGQRGNWAADAGPHAALHRAGAHARAGQPGGARVCRVRAHAGRRLLLRRCALAAPCSQSSCACFLLACWQGARGQTHGFAASAPTLVVGCFYGGARLPRRAARTVWSVCCSPAGTERWVASAPTPVVRCFCGIA